MLRKSFNDDFKMKRIYDNHNQSGLIDVSIPYDAMIHTERRPDSPNGTKKGFFENGVFEYYKIFELDKRNQGKSIYLEFEGVYRNARVYLNGLFVKENPNGYTEFTCDITDIVKFNELNVLKVVALTSDDSRWYSGAGIYRDVNILIGNPTHFEINGIRISTRSLDDDSATISVSSKIKGTDYDEIGYEIIDKDKAIISSMKTKDLNSLVEISSPSAWSDENPYLYTLKSYLYRNGEIIDESIDTFGIRTINVSSTTGLLVNSRKVKLRGCCIHHDNGVIGANSYYEVEYRKLRKIKESGFNAIRIAHHPAGRNTLRAADELGLYVMEESFDMWVSQKSYDDYSLFFNDWSERDLISMIDKDYNHPSIIMYSLGNEISDLASKAGYDILERLNAIVKKNDGTRFTTIAINNVMLILALSEARQMIDGDSMSQKSDVNETMNNTREKMKEFSKGPVTDYLLKRPSEIVDIVGYNYMPERYEIDKTLHEDRVIVGSETYPKDIASMWEYIINNDNVIGDFTWVGYDYLGETGIGKITYNDKVDVQKGIYGDYPYVTADCADIDITGFRLPQSYFREIVFGLRKKPYIAVFSPSHYYDTPCESLWSFEDTIGSYDFMESEGKPIRINVYSASKEVELFINGKSVGRKPVESYKATFDTVYEKGCVEAIAYYDSKEEKTILESPDHETKKLDIQVEQIGSFVFADIIQNDENGITITSEELLVKIEYSKNLSLLGLGNGSPIMDRERYDDDMHMTYNGRAYAIFRISDEGKAFIKANDKIKEFDL